MFKEYTGEALLFAVRQALHPLLIWKRIQLNGMARIFRGKGPAAEYAKLYEARGPLVGAGKPHKVQEGPRAREQVSRAARQAARNHKPAGTI